MVDKYLNATKVQISILVWMKNEQGQETLVKTKTTFSDLEA